MSDEIKVGRSGRYLVVVVKKEKGYATLVGPEPGKWFFKYKEMFIWIMLVCMGVFLVLFVLYLILIFALLVIV